MFEVGTEVEAAFEGGSNWYAAVIRCISVDCSNGGDTYTVYYPEDEETEENVPAQCIRQKRAAPAHEIPIKPETKPPSTIRDGSHALEEDEEEIELSGWSTHQIVEYTFNSQQIVEERLQSREGGAIDQANGREEHQSIIKVKCCPELTPYDAILLAEGEDLTGNRVMWCRV